MSNKKSFLLYKEWAEPVNMLSDNQAGQLLKAMFLYWSEGVISDFSEDPALKMISSFIFSQFQRDEVAYEEKCSKNKVNGMKGGRPKKPKEPTETERFSEKPKKADEDKDKDKDKDEDEDNDSEKQKKRIIFKPPSIEDVRQYCTERNNNVNPEAFVDFYSAKGWMVGKNKMRDWKAAVRNWERNEKGNGNGKEHYGNEKGTDSSGTDNYNFDRLFI